MIYHETCSENSARSKMRGERVIIRQCPQSYSIRMYERRRKERIKQGLWRERRSCAQAGREDGCCIDLKAAQRHLIASPFQWPWRMRTGSSSLLAALPIIPRTCYLRAGAERRCSVHLRRPFPRNHLCTIAHFHHVYRERSPARNSRLLWLGRRGTGISTFNYAFFGHRNSER